MDDLIIIDKLKKRFNATYNKLETDDYWWG